MIALDANAWNWFGIAFVLILAALVLALFLWAERDEKRYGDFDSVEDFDRFRDDLAYKAEGRKLRG